MGRVLIGTASWTDPSLIKAGTFYPPEANDAESRLRHYAQHFPLVEVDSSYYALPSERTAALWAKRTPESFTFDVKAFSLFTNHPTKPAALPRDVARAIGPIPQDKKNLYYRDVPEELRDELFRRFKGALDPLRESGKMGLVLLQFPPWFSPSNDNREHIVRTAANLDPYRCSVEFRSSSWLSEKNQEGTLSFLRENNLPFVCVDEPQGFKSSVPPVAAATSDVALIRFHGRNAETWEKKGLTPSERFNWYYSEGAMGEWVPKVADLAQGAREVHALMNTNYGDQGIVNARLLQRLLGQLQFPLVQPEG